MAAPPGPNPTESTPITGGVWWTRDPANPVLPPQPDSPYDSHVCMNPFLVRRGQEYWLYYAGGDGAGRRRICLAVAPVDDPTRWTRRGVVLDVGPPGAFDANWVVLPHVVPAGDRWHLYYSSHCGHGRGLGAFRGLGLAVSDDGVRFRRHGDSPVLAPTGRDGDPDAVGIAGGSVLRVPQPGGGFKWRFYYTGCPTVGDDVFLDQQKCCCLARSDDGLAWEKLGAVLVRDPQRDYEDIAVAGPVVQRRADGRFGMWYSAIGTRWGYYSIGYAESDDGLTWRRGEHYGDNLQLGPIGDGWERQMVAYPAVAREGSTRRLFYCGNGYGATGIGTATAAPLRALATVGPCRLRVQAPEPGFTWDYRLPEGVACDAGLFKSHAQPVLDWNGPTADGVLWHEWQTDRQHRAEVSAEPMYRDAGLDFLMGLRYRVIVRHTEFGLAVSFTATNLSDRVFGNVTAFPCLASRSAEFFDEALGRTWIEGEAGLTRLAETDRGTGEAVRTHYHVRGQWPMGVCLESFWGRASATEATGGAIVRSSADGRWTVGTSWQRVCEIFHNEDQAHHCIHSVPTLGDLAPGQTKTVHGRVVFVEGGPDEAMKHLRF